MIKHLSARELKKLMDSGEVLLVDVREPEEYAISNIKGSVLLPLSTFEPSQVPQAKGKKLVFHCKAGKRSFAACELFSKEHPEAEVWNLDGGILSWEKEGY